MDETLRALGGLLLEALPTFLIVLFLFVYLKYVFFRPLDKVLNRRFEATAGAREIAEATFLKADKRASEYETALRDARTEIYKEQEEFRRAWRQEHASRLEETRAGAQALLSRERESLAREVEAARDSLRKESEALAAQIAAAILGRRTS